LLAKQLLTIYKTSMAFEVSEGAHKKGIINCWPRYVDTEQKQGFGCNGK
jgi:hypothetical protein